MCAVCEHIQRTPKLEQCLNNSSNIAHENPVSHPHKNKYIHRNWQNGTIYEGLVNTLICSKVKCETKIRLLHNKCGLSRPVYINTFLMPAADCLFIFKLNLNRRIFVFIPQTFSVWLILLLKKQDTFFI